MAGLIVLTFWGLLFNKKWGRRGGEKEKRKSNVKQTRIHKLPRKLSSMGHPKHVHSTAMNCVTQLGPRALMSMVPASVSFPEAERVRLNVLGETSQV